MTRHARTAQKGTVSRMLVSRDDPVHSSNITLHRALPVAGLPSDDASGRHFEICEGQLASIMELPCPA